tara:strand:+ start:2530 stop:3027 length:498 start_codon:yes stop_codon:yes gene_type:complete
MSDDGINTKNWNVLATVEKWHRAEDRHEGLPPDEVVEAKDNLLLNGGIQLLLDLLIGAGGTVYNNSNAYIGVGDSSTSAAATQDALQASSNKSYKGMESSFPSRSAQTLSFKSVWGSSDGNFAWNEWSISNSNSDSGVNLNRKVASLGTKASGSEWTLTVTITVS